MKLTNITNQQNELAETEHRSIDDLDLNNRLINCLKRNGIFQLEQLLKLSDDDLRSLNWLGVNPWYASQKITTEFCGESMICDNMGMILSRLDDKEEGFIISDVSLEMGNQMKKIDFENIGIDNIERYLKKTENANV